MSQDLYAWTVVILFAGILLVAITAQAYRIQRDWFAQEVLKQYEWIDEIIEALEDESE